MDRSRRDETGAATFPPILAKAGAALADVVEDPESIAALAKILADCYRIPTSSPFWLSLWVPVVLACLCRLGFLRGGLFLSVSCNCWRFSVWLGLYLREAWRAAGCHRWFPCLAGGCQSVVLSWGSFCKSGKIRQQTTAGNHPESDREASSARNRPPDPQKNSQNWGTCWNL
jgi:hypothetical protein